MALFRFVGSESIIGNVRVNAFGQLLDLDPLTAHDCVLGHVGLVPDDEFKLIKLTEDQLSRYGDFLSHKDADDDFIAKKAKAHAAAVAHRIKYENAVANGDTFMARAAGQKRPAPAQPAQPTRPTEPAAKSE